MHNAVLRSGGRRRGPEAGGCLSSKFRYRRHGSTGIMIASRRVLAVVPARSGSKGIPDKNMQVVAGRSLIAHAAWTLKACPTVDRSIISTDTQAYADEGVAHGLDAPFLRPAHLSHDTAGAVETMIHAVGAAQAHYGEQFDLIAIVEPTCPL